MKKRNGLQIRVSVKGGGKLSSAGLTLFELMMIVAVTAIVLTIASPSFVVVSSLCHLREATREVVTDLQLTRLLAVKENRDFRVNFSHSSYRVVRISDGSETKSRNFASDYPEISLAGAAVTFDSRGNASAQTIIVSNPRGAKNITVNATGKVKVE